LSPRIEHDISLVPQREVARWRGAIGNGRAVTDLRVQAWLRESLLNGEAPVRIHPGVSRVLRHLRAQTDGLGDVSLPTLASIAGLSQSRFTHVFSESTGVAVVASGSSPAATRQLRSARP
jgi:AraC-like DNA-binding protein